MSLPSALQSIDYIKSCCAHMGAFQGTNEVHEYIVKVANEIAQAPPSLVFPERYGEHVAHAMLQIAHNKFTSPPAAVASVYLATRFEYYFRVSSGLLAGDGTWLNPAGHAAAQSMITDQRLKKARISSVSLAYKVMKLNTGHALAQRSAALDAALYPQAAVGASSIKDIGDRIEFGRHAIGHGQWGDPSSEGVFYALTTALVFHSRA